jgi:hypothetical protein
MKASNHSCTEEQIQYVMANATSYYEKSYPGEGRKLSACIESKIFSFFCTIALSRVVS